MVIEIRHMDKDDEDAVVEICHVTGDGFLKKLIPTPYLFGLFFCLYYVWHETKNCFVATDTETGRVVGYILGTLDSAKQHHDFKEKIPPRVKEYRANGGDFPLKTRLFSYFIFHQRSNKKLYDEYPGHLHIDILPKYQRKGIGHRLVQALETHFKSKGISDYHLQVGSGNKNAIAFYRKCGMALLSKKPFNLTFGKKLIE